MNRGLKKNRDQSATEDFPNLEGVKYEKLILPNSSIEFLVKMGRISDMNLYLAQNRFGCEIKLERKKDAGKGADKKEDSKRENSKKEESKKEESKKEEPKKNYSSLLAEFVRNDSKKDTYFCGGKLTKLMELLNRRNKGIMDSFPFHEEYPFHPYDKLILGVGTGAYLGTQPLRLHPLYGIPFIPASVIKGTLRSAWISERYDGDEKKAEKAEDFIDLFGGNGKEVDAREGKLRFFDIFPNRFEIGLDVQAVHYKDYYGNSTIPPTDDQITMPVFFMCLRKAEFNIFICCRDEKVWNGCKGELGCMMDKVYKIYGIGAKTALGYGIVKG
ncbi:type III-B CRISPR module RAMP protein Cmr6 [Clostridium sp. MCC353]|uniref:type III-B CRISPR module RAMP protein Cmr6 n=1 Tax=Clostridium sp. MCC353 TaxID=2592646 RepID=UPI001C035C56|nr:type III-B CRISPR module RAMP protein Cmr6 [Clostridium sp. MCC353]MBT9778142.1 type III-B CRISPR module RAMP protein Cmr6 [Clostridium sp. MCC353]